MLHKYSRSPPKKSNMPPHEASSTGLASLSKDSRIRGHERSALVEFFSPLHTKTGSASHRPYLGYCTSSDRRSY